MYFRIIVMIGLPIVGYRLCRAIFGRFRADLAVLRESQDSTQKAVIVFWWVITLVVVFGIVVYELNELGFGPLY